MGGRNKMKTVLIIFIAIMLAIPCYADDLTDIYQQQLLSLYQQMNVCLQRCVMITQHELADLKMETEALRLGRYIPSSPAQKKPHAEIRQIHNKILETKITIAEKNNGKLPESVKHIEESFKFSEKQQQELSFALGK